ncbi:MAG: glycosyltransferase family 8 protein [Roseburia sp.]|nr:glycosyltransferase family 8 protein [Roseburia sp.]
MNILYSLNNRYVPVAGVSIVSLLENNKDVQEIHIFLIDCGMTDESKKILSDLVGNYNRMIKFIPLDDLVNDGDLNAPNKSYYGRFFGTQITEEDRLLYLDCDLLINGSLEELYQTEMHDAWIAGVQGPGASYECRQRIGFPEEKQYLNTGMLLMNLKAWRAEKVTEKLVDFLNLHGEIPPYHDQNIINAVCYDHMLVLEPKYNLLWSMMCCKPKHICRLNKIKKYYTDAQIQEAVKAPVIIHFSNSIYGRPWYRNCKHPYKELFIKYRNLSPWEGEPLPESGLSFFRRFRNAVYRNVPSYIYYLLHVIEKKVLKSILPKLPIKNLKQWVAHYMNGE